MTVLHIAESAFGGGAESVFRDTILGLKEFDSNTHLVTCKCHSDLPFKIDLVFKEHEKAGVSKILSQIFSLSNYRALSMFLKKNKPDIIHIQNYGNLSPSILRAIKSYKTKSHNIKVLHTVHTFEYLCSHHAAFDYKKKQRCLDCANSKFKFKIFYRHCSRGGVVHSIGKGLTSLLANYYLSGGLIDRYITPSDFLKDEMCKSRIQKEKVSVIKNPLPDNFLSKALNSNESVKHTVNEVVYFGRLSNEKNIDILIRAIAKLINDSFKVKLKIIGDGVEKQRLASLVKEMGISNQVEFIPFLKQEDLQKILSKAKVSVLPSKCFETASMLVFESVASGVIPIVADHGGMKEMAEYMNVGYRFQDDNEEDLASKIKLAFENYLVEINSLVLAKNKLEDLSLKNYASAISELYKTLLKSNINGQHY